MFRKPAHRAGRRLIIASAVLAAIAVAAGAARVVLAATAGVVPQSGSQITLVKTLGGGDAYSGENDNGDEVGIQSETTQTWQTMILPGYGQGSCCPSNVPAKMTVVVPSGTRAFFRVTLSGQVGCLPNGAVINDAGCFVRVLVGGRVLAPDAVVFARAEPRGTPNLFTDSHAAQFVSAPLAAGTYALVVQWSTLEASFTSDQFMITVDRIETAA
jgi:hypothetical protein